MGRRPKHVLNEDALAHMADVSVTTWRGHKVQGCPVPTSEPDLKPWLKRYSAWRLAHGKVDPTERASTPTGAPPQDAEDLRLKREHQQIRNRIAKLQLEARERLVLPRAVVVAYASDAVITVRQKLDAFVRAMAARYGPRIGGSGEIEMLESMGAEIDRVCEDFAKGMARTHDDDALAQAEAVDGAGVAVPGTGDQSELAADAEADGQPVG